MSGDPSQSKTATVLATARARGIPIKTLHNCAPNAFVVTRWYENGFYLRICSTCNLTVGSGYAR